VSNKLDLIYDLLKADREDGAAFRKEVRESHKDTGDRLSKLETQGEVQNQQLAEHIRRTEILESLHMSNEGKIGLHEDRIIKLEEPAKVVSVLKKWVIGASAVVTAIVTIAKFIGLF